MFAPRFQADDPSVTRKIIDPMNNPIEMSAPILRAVQYAYPLSKS